MKKYFQRKTCRLCESANVKRVMQFIPTPVGDQYVSRDQLNETQDEFPMDMYFCESCGQIQLLDVVNPEFIYKDYLYETSASLGLVEHFERYAKSLIDKIDIAKEELVIDIGCNDGSFLQAFANEGMRVLGVEPATAIAKKVQAKNLNVINTFFTEELSDEIVAKHGRAKMVSANNVMANIENLNDFVKGVANLLDEDGVFIFESGYMIDTIGNSVIDNFYHEHLCYFSLKPLIPFFKKHGLEVVDAQRVDTKGGSLRGMVQKIGGKRSISSSVNELLNKEEAAGFDSINFYLDFAKQMERVRDDLLVLLKSIKSEGKKIAGYGASVGVTTLLYYYGADKYLDVLFDDNPIKQDLYSPGLHIPVVASDDIYNQNPDYILCFPWRYKEPIMKRHQKYLEQGGKFIIPLPELSVVENQNVIGTGIQ